MPSLGASSLEATANLTPLARMQYLAQELDLDGILLCEPPSLRYVLGIRHQSDFDSPWGPSEGVCIIPRAGTPIGVLPDTLRRASLSLSTPDVRFYPSYTINRYPTPIEDMVDAIAAALRDVGLDSARLGIEARAFPMAGAHALALKLLNMRLSDVSEHMPLLRVVKTPAEIDMLRRAVAISISGQRVARREARANMAEIEVFSLVRHAMETEAGMALPGLIADFLSGPRSAQGGGPASVRRIQFGEMIICDLVVCVDGYWGDTTSSFAVGAPDDEQLNIHYLVQEALQRGLDAVRPGVPANRIDATVRGFLKDKGYHYRHHSGHGIGVTYHEQPMIVPYNELILHPGMVLVIEPGIYLEGKTGVRLEDAVVVTRGGYELLSRHDKSIV